MYKKFNDERDCFFEKQFGLFVHWGIYSVSGWQEQEQYRRGLSRSEYVPLMKKFNPDKFDPEEWLDIAEAAGMQYLCFTSKHIDGFCMWETAQTDYNVMNTPYQKDVLAKVAEACHRRNFPLFIYYSVPDMNCEYYPNQGRNYELPEPESGDKPDVVKYLEFVKAQIRELCTNYGKIHGFWWDGGKYLGNLWDIHDESLNELVRSLQPGIIINNRGFNDGDFSTPERDYEFHSDITEQRIYEQPTEACESIGRESWGYRRNEDYFSIGHLARCIDKHLAKGGNYLLNVGPRPDGLFPQQTIEILENIGKWHQKVKEAFIDAEPVSFLSDNPKILLTRKNNILYVHLFREPECSGVILKPINMLPRRASVLNNGQQIDAAVELMPTLFKDKKAYLHLWNIPVNQFAGEAIIIKLEFEKFPEKR